MKPPPTSARTRRSSSPPTRCPGCTRPDTWSASTTTSGTPPPTPTPQRPCTTRALQPRHRGPWPRSAPPTVRQAHATGETTHTRSTPPVSLADEYDVDVTFYHRDGTIYVDTRAGAPEPLLVLLDGLGLDRHSALDDTWHQ